MVIKILKNSTTFNGIQYSDNKTEKGEGSLLAAENFPFEDMDANDYNDYLEAQSDLNKRVKNKQFHVSISTKGKEHSFEELKEVAKKYLDYMGYKDNPYLIYAHRDSPNNHIHIVSTRVDENGNKISDSLEKARTQKFIKNELRINFSADISSTIKNAFDYKFRDISSLQAILKTDGYKSRMNKKGLEVIKSGKVQDIIPKKKIKDHMYHSRFDHKQKNRIKAIMYRYASGSDFNILKSSLRQKFGYELSYSYSNKDPDKNQVRSSNTIVDYHLIDHKAKTIYSSNDLLTMDQIQKEFDSVLSKEELAQILYDVKQDPSPINDLRGFLAEHNIVLKYNGDIGLRSGELLMKMDGETLHNIKYQQRLLDIQKLDYSPNVSKSMISKIYKVDVKDIELTPRDLSAEELIKYRELVESQLYRNSDSISNVGELKIYNTTEGPILLDHEKGRMLHLKDDLDIEVSSNKNIPVLKNDTEPVLEYSQKSGMEISDIYTDDLNTGDQKRKKRRKRQMNINQ